MNHGKLLAITNMSIAVCATVGYLLVGDYQRAVYWASATILTASVTF